jgi:hypothetical protein
MEYMDLFQRAPLISYIHEYQNLLCCQKKKTEIATMFLRRIRAVHKGNLRHTTMQQYYNLRKRGATIYERFVFITEPINVPCRCTDLFLLASVVNPPHSLHIIQGQRLNIHTHTMDGRVMMALMVLAREWPEGERKNRQN